MVLINSLGLTVSDYIALAGFVIFVLGLVYALWNKVDKNKTKIQYMEVDIKSVKKTQSESEVKLERRIENMTKQSNKDHQALQGQLSEMNTAIADLPIKILDLLKQ